MKRALRILVRVACLFGLFVPFGYLPWFWAVPAALVSALFLAAITVKPKPAGTPSA